MRAMVRGFVIWTLGLAMLFGSSAASSAAPPIPVVTYCGCTCWYSGPGGKTATKGMTFTTDKSCSIYSGQTCYCDDQTCSLEPKEGARYKGALYDCKKTLPMKQIEPAPTVPQRGVKPPVAPGVQPPAAR